MTIFDLFIAIMGIYMIMEAFKMKRTGEISKTVVNEKEINHCKDKKGFIDFVYTKAIVFGVILMLYGILDYVNKHIYSFGVVLDIVMLVVFIGGFVWFMKQLSKARGKFFGFR